MGNQFAAFVNLSEKISIESDMISNCYTPCLYGAKNIYRKIYLNKRGAKSKKRKILMPCTKLKIVQKSILDYLEPLSEKKLKECVIAYRKGKSIKDAATPHIRADRLIKIDIQDFFPSIDRKKVDEALKWIGIKDAVERGLLSALCTFRDELPQWAPTSPLIANIVARKIDTWVLRLISKYWFNSIRYTRYADDMIFSFHDTWFVEPEYRDFIEEVIKVVEKNEFSVNFGKIWSYWKGACHCVTGITVNDKLSLGRDKYRKLRAWIHEFQRKKVEENFDSLYAIRDNLMWRLAFLNQVNPDLANSLKLKYDTDSLFILPQESSIPVEGSQ